MCDYSVGLAKEYAEKGRAEGRTEGRAEGETKLATLMDFLFKAGRASDAQKAASDENARKEFYREFGIID